jgi:aminoglycoside phosphotransferase (APT) family kinase protein
LRALHQPAPADAPRNPYRGVPLEQRRDKFETCLERLRPRSNLLKPDHLGIWREALAAPVDAAPTWIHGDLHPRNVLVRQGEISGVIDWGDVAQGDRACDLAAIWLLLPARSSRFEAMDACVAGSAATWRRARGWALFFAAILLDAGLIDDPRMAAIAERTLARLLDGP